MRVPCAKTALRPPIRVQALTVEWVTLANVMGKDSYSEPTILWRLRHGDGRTARSVVVPRSINVTAIWFVADSPEGAAAFEEWHDAVSWLEVTRASLLATGWSESPE